ncbi:MAG TPA: hypothetical protein VJV21_07595 [Pyrinomonadaceae bacterium]|nr:hypothetical protein [Pyrinomonadaceae bacterium]
MAKLRRTCILLTLLVATLSRSFLPTVGAQRGNSTALIESEKQEAHKLSVTFTERLGQTTDFSTVMHELFVPDAVERYLAEEKRRAAKFGATSITVSPGIFVDPRLLDSATPDDWRRLFNATYSFLLLGFVHALVRKTDFDNLQAADLYPPEVIRLLDADPLLRNVVKKKGDVRSFASPSEMRAATAVLEQANVLSRKAIPNPIDLEAIVVQMALGNSTKQRGISQEQRLLARESLNPALHITDEEYFGFPQGSRMIWVRTFSFLDLLLIRVDGKLRIVWAQPIAD